MEANLNTILEAQAEIEVLNGNSWPTRLAKLEEKLRKHVMRMRNSQVDLDAHEIGEFIENLAEANNFRTHRVHYQSVTPAPDGHVMLQYEATLDKFHCFIYVRDI